MNYNYWYPCLTYIVRILNKASENLMKTIEVIDRFRDEDFKRWTFSLLLVLIGGTVIEKDSVLGAKEFAERSYRRCSSWAET